MLIFDSKKGKFGTQKPAQWGPISSVRAAVFRNAEAMGIDPATLQVIIPFWEGAGAVKNIVTGHDGGLNGNGFWNNTSIHFDQAFVETDVYLPQTEALTVIVEVLSDSTNPDKGICANYEDSNWGDGTGFALWRKSNDGLSLYVANDESKYISNEFPSGTRGQLCAVWQSGEYQDLYLDSRVLIPTTAGLGSGVMGASSLPIRVGSYYSERSWDGDIFYCYVFTVAIDDATRMQLFEAPYALLLPNPTPLIFDLGAGSGASGSLTAPSASIALAISSGELFGSQAGTLASPSASVVIANTAGELQGSKSGSLLAPSVNIGISAFAGTLAGSEAGTLSSPSASIGVTGAAGTLQGSTVGLLVSPPLSVGITNTIGALQGNQSGALTAPAASIGISAFAGTLSGSDAGILSAPSTAVGITNIAGVLSGASTGSMVHPALSVPVANRAGTLRASQAGVLTAPSASIGVAAQVPVLGISTPTTCTLSDETINTIVDRVYDRLVAYLVANGGLTVAQDATLNAIASKTDDIPGDVWNTDDAQKLLEENLGKAVVSPDDRHVTIRKRSDGSISHEYDISVDKRERTPV